jgi:sarcosine oxidase subunit beta
MVFTTGPLPEALAAHQPLPLTVDLGNGFWFRSERDRLIFGLSNPADTGFSEGIDWAWLETTYEAALAHFPWFDQLSVDRRASWWGYYEVTPDHNPVIGRHPGADGWIDACGFSGHGVQQAAAVGRIVAQEACGEAPFIDVDALRIGRFTAAPDDATGGGERLIV